MGGIISIGQEKTIGTTGPKWAYAADDLILDALSSAAFRGLGDVVAFRVDTTWAFS